MISTVSSLIALAINWFGQMVLAATVTSSGEMRLRISNNKPFLSVFEIDSDSESVYEHLS